MPGSKGCCIAEYLQNCDELEYSGNYHDRGTLLAGIEYFCVVGNAEVYDWQTMYKFFHGFFDKIGRCRISPLIERKEGFFGTDPYENTKMVFEKMENKAQMGENTST